MEDKNRYDDDIIDLTPSEDGGHKTKEDDYDIFEAEDFVADDGNEASTEAIDPVEAKPEGAAEVPNIESDDETKAEEAPTPRASKKTNIAVIACCACTALVLCAVGFDIWSNNHATEPEAVTTVADSNKATPAKEGSTANAKVADEEAAEATCEHVWQARYRLEHTDQQAHTESVAATYKDEYVLETVCNTCEAVVTGQTERHTGLTGHSSFSTNVPVLETFVDVPEHEITVIDQEESNRYVLVGYKCEECGDEISVEEAQAQGVYKTEDETNVSAE